MAKLTSLPNEVLCPILEACMPLSFENLMLSCKTVFFTGIRYIPQHNRLKEAYHRFEFCKLSEASSDELWGVDSSLDLLVKIQREPLVARYIKYADFFLDGSRARRNSQHRGYRTARRPHPAVSRALTESLSRLLQESSLIACSNQDVDTWLMQMLDTRATAYGMCTIAFVFLLTILPNLTSLRFPVWWPASLQYLNGANWQILNDAASAAANNNQPRTFGENVPLSQLKQIHSHWIPCRGWMVPQIWNPFLLLPSLEILRAFETSDQLATPHYVCLASQKLPCSQALR